MGWREALLLSQVRLLQERNQICATKMKKMKSALETALGE